MTEPAAPTGPTTAPGTVDAARFRAAMARVPAAVTITTTLDADGAPRGFTASSLVSVSLEPPLIAVCVGLTSNCYPAFATCERFAVSVLGPEHVPLARTFASKSADKFAHGRFARTPGGLPVVEGARVAVECRVHGRHPAGDHLILVGAVRAVDGAEGDRLVYGDRTFTTLKTS
ncbi:flavin reductase family protein [Saccharopolyspora rosea]|uniref:Flavin reductase family protein n=1 Tax=Saccharopolyspora rosea TaxID=524884 RepID=A0ABW3FTD5_9PSEU|nr:flavin reductase family protein [Saccharopolyspora rosea]